MRGVRPDREARSRRAYLAALASTAAVGGCLQFTESSAPATTRTGTATETAVTTGSSRTDDADSRSARDATRWTFEADAPFVAGPVHADGTVVATSVDRHVYGVDATTGDRQWAAETETSLENGLTVVDGVAVAAGIEEQLGVDVGDGETTYQHVDFEHGIRAQAAGDDLVFQGGFLNGGVRAVRPTTGEVAWSDERGESSVSATPIDHDGETVCVGFHPDGDRGEPPWAFAGYDVSSGEQLWEVERDLDLEYVRPHVAVSDGVCFGHSGDDHFVAVDARSGDVRTEEEPEDAGTLYGAVDGTAVMTKRTELHGIDVTNGETRWQSEKKPADGTFSFDGSTLWFVDGDDTLHRADVPSGEIEAVQPLELGGATLTGDLVVTDDAVIVTTEDATLRALERA